MTSTIAADPQRPGTPDLPSAGRRRELPPWFLPVTLGVLVTAGLVLRFFARQALWLDESQSVAIAKLPLHGPSTTLWTGLKQDGSPPLYYLLLHAWIELFGTGTAVVRALSAVLNLVAIYPLYLLAKRVVGLRPARVVTILYICSPYALYYATETRMYSLVILLTVLYGLALEQTLRRPSVLSILSIGVTAAGLALTHYWCIYLLITMTGILFLWAWRRKRKEAWQALLGQVIGGVLLLPWLPTLLFQLKHTGTPWGEPASLSAVLHAYGWWAGGPSVAGRLALLVVAPLIVFAVCGTAISTRAVQVGWKINQPGALLFGITTGTLIVAIVIGQATGSAYADRYTATAFVPFLLLTGVGTAFLLSERVLVVAIGSLALLGIVAGAALLLAPRTQAQQAATALARSAKPGDVVMVCPDQIGPSVRRLAPKDLAYYAAPTFTDPGRVDWTDYKPRNENANPVAVAQRAVDMAGPEHNVFIVYAEGYVTYKELCPGMRQELRTLRPKGAHGYFNQKPDLEGMEVDIFPAQPTAKSTG
ncbi:MAG TPA: glycosyltransferase family 39 protein [Frankiaceae bacterium]|nr:glycosyltransferase family 39 protein [Frankiaceae bacterium]